jgi:uncharacterized protein HemX
MTQTQFLLSLTALLSVVGLGLSYLIMKDDTDRKQQELDAREKEKNSRDRISQIYFECPTSRQRLSNSYISEDGIVLLPDNYYPYDGTA